MSRTPPSAAVSVRWRERRWPTGYGAFVLSSDLQFIKAGKVVPLGTSERKRSPLTPDVPALGEHPALQDIDVSAWFMLVGPAGLPPAVTSKLQAAS